MIIDWVVNFVFHFLAHNLDDFFMSLRIECFSETSSPHSKFNELFAFLFLFEFCWEWLEYHNHNVIHKYNRYSILLYGTISKTQGNVMRKMQLKHFPTSIRIFRFFFCSFMKINF